MMRKFGQCELVSGLQRLAFGGNFNQRLDNVRLPRRLQHLAFGILASMETSFPRTYQVRLIVTEQENDGV